MVADAQSSPNQVNEAWVLALACSPPLLICFLSDGCSHVEHGYSAWPAAGGQALPPALLQTLAGAHATGLRLQLDAQLDDWPWEAELERGCGELAVSRLLSKPPGGLATDIHTDTPAVAVDAAALGSASRDDPAWVHGPTAAWLPLAWAAQAQGRPLLAVAGGMAPDAARRFRLALQARWGPECRLGAAALQAAADSGLPRSAWRLYGDALFTPSAEAGDAHWRQVTSVSIDLIRSTSLLHDWGAERYAESHAAFHRLSERIVQAHGGRLDDPQGDDGLMAYFGLLQAQEDAAAQAVRASWALVQGVPQLGFSVRLGVATGRLAVSQAQPFGMEVHLAARLQRVAPANGIVISDRTRALLGPGVLCEPLPEPVALAGFDAPVVAYRVVDLPAPGAVQRQRLAQGQFVGRRQELAALAHAWAQACSQRRGQYHCVLGEPGIGKSRLLQEFELAVRQGGLAVTLIKVFGHAQTQSSAFAALAAALQGPALPLLATLSQRSSSPNEGAPAHERQLERIALLDALVAEFLELAERAPLCCIVDDAQWLDPSTVELVERLRVQSVAVPLLLVISLREDARSLQRGLHTEDATTLRGLDRAESMNLIGALSASVPLSGDLQQLIAGRAGGVPLFLEETVRMVEHLEGDAFEGVTGIPATLEDLLMARLDALGAARAMAQLAAVLGVEFPAPLWQAVLAEPDDWIQRAQGAGAGQRLLDSGLLIRHDTAGPRYRFKHALIRDAAYESLWVRDRKRLHGIVARVLERTPHDGLAGFELRAHHLAAAGEMEAAFSAWALAARQAAAAAADREALALSQRALALLPGLPDTPATRAQALQLHLLQAARYIGLDGYGAASVESAYLRAAALCSEVQDRLMRTRVELGLEACYAMRGDLRRARALAETAVRNTPWDDNLRLALQARWAWTNVVFHQGDLVPALEMIDECLQRYHHGLFQPGAVQDPAIMCLSYGAWGLFERGCAGQARLRVQRLLALAQALDHPFSHAVAHGFAASVALFCGDYAQGLNHAEEAVRRCTANAFQAWLAHAQIMRGRLRAALGEPEDGLAEMEQGMALWTATGARITCATYLAFQAEVCLQMGQPEAALPRLAQARDIATQHGERYHEAELMRLQGWALWQLRQDERDAAAAQGLLGDALARAREQGKLGFALRSALALGSTWAAQGQQARAAALLREAIDAVPDHQLTLDSRAAQAAWHAWNEREPDSKEGNDHVPLSTAPLQPGRPGPAG